MIRVLSKRERSMSGIFGTLLGALTGQQGQSGQQSNIMGTVQQVLAENGGVQGLISRFNESGFGDHVQSWVNGDPKPITGNQVDQVFPSEQIEGWASQLGLDPDGMRTVLAEAIPHVVDHLTPGGQVPE